MLVKDRDELDTLLREWKSPGPPEELDPRVASAYRAAVRRSAWTGFWRWRVSVPAPVLLAAALAVFALAFWLRPAAAVPAPAIPSITPSGFQPLPNGEARIVPVAEVQK